MAANSCLSSNTCQAEGRDIRRGRTEKKGDRKRPVSPEISLLVNRCACELKECRGDCCRNLRVAYVSRPDQRRFPMSQQRHDTAVLSYGSMETSRPLSAPALSLDCRREGKEGEEEGEEDGRDSSKEPLLKAAQRHKVSTSSSGSAGPSLENSVRCGCHVKVVDHTTRKAVLKLLVASLVALLFMVGEVLGGYFANSLAIMTDAAHMLSDFAGFLISLFAIWVGRRPPSRGMSFGWYRAEVIGALVSVLIIWVITGVLFYEAVLRVVHRDFEVDANIMLITACVGVFVNVFMCMVLGHGHGHSHGGHGGHGGHGHRGRRGREGKKKDKSVENINVRAAFIHVIGDLIQSIGVVIAGYIISFKPEWKLADPICTFVFCVLVLFSTFNILKDALRVVMEGTPKHLDYETVKADLNAVEGVKQAHSLHIWSLTLNRTALSAHLVLKPDARGDDVLQEANRVLQQTHHISHTTLQVESYQEIMSECGQCQEPERTGVLQGLLPCCLQWRSVREARHSTLA